MYYEKRVTIPPGTLASNPILDVIEVHPGILKHVWVSFPPGCCALAHLQVQYMERVIYPANPNADITGDAETISFDEDVLLSDPPFEFTLVGWNEDDTFSHTLIVRMQILSQENDMTSLLRLLTVGLGGG
jgi:hypothetical protein